MNYLAPQELIVQRLQGALPAGVPVKTAVDFAQAKDLSVGQAEVWVFFQGDQVKDTSHNRTLVEQRWAVMYFAPGIMPDMARDGAVLSAATKALAGYDPYQAGMGEFKRVGSLVPMSFSADGLVAYGMLFAIAVDL